MLVRKSRKEFNNNDNENNNLLNMRVTVILIEVGTLGTVPKDLERRPEKEEIRERPSKLHNWLARIFIRILEIRGDLLLLRLQEKTTN